VPRKWKNGIAAGFIRTRVFRPAHGRGLIPWFSRAYTGVFRRLCQGFSTCLSTEQKYGCAEQKCGRKKAGKLSRLVQALAHSFIHKAVKRATLATS
jgi:hypothetical protein